jgi:hypothetical protein
VNHLGGEHDVAQPWSVIWQLALPPTADVNTSAISDCE